MSFLWGFDQLHFAVSGAVEDHDFAFGVAEDEDVAVAEVGFFDGLFEGHGMHGDGFIGADEVNLGGFGHRRIAVHGDGDGGFFGDADFSLSAGFGAGSIPWHRVTVPLFYFLALAGGAFFGFPLGLVLHGLLFEVVEGAADGDHHVFGLGQADQWPIARVNGGFGFVAVLFDGEDGFGFEAVAENFADFSEAKFYFFTDGGSDFVVSSGIFHVHERPSLKFLL